jgi:hypothetical protein
MKAVGAVFMQDIVVGEVTSKSLKSYRGSIAPLILDVGSR